MTYSNFTRPLWSWLAGDAPHVNFFGTPLPGPNRTGAEDFLATHLDLAAAFSWDVRQQNMNALNSHDTARAATVMIDGGQRLGAVLMFTLPGVPVVFAGDEFGLKGHNGEASRTPMPWNDPDRVLADLRDDYAALAGAAPGPARTDRRRHPLAARTRGRPGIRAGNGRELRARRRGPGRRGSGPAGGDAHRRPARGPRGSPAFATGSSPPAASTPVSRAPIPPPAGRSGRMAPPHPP